MVHPSASIPPSACVGPGTVVLAGVVATTGVQIGAHVAVMPSVVLTHDDVVCDFATLGSGARLAGDVMVGEGAYIGAGALVREHCRIGAWALVGMGAGVTGDVPARRGVGRPSGASLPPRGRAPARHGVADTVSPFTTGGIRMTTVQSAPAVTFVDLASQHAEIEHEVEEGLRRVMDACAFVNGPDVAAFESAWAGYCGRSHALGVANGTDALELALRAAGVGTGDEVVVPANSFIASAEAVARTGAGVRLVDCDPLHLLIDPDLIAEARTARTRAVLPVHLYGQIAPMEAVAAAAAAGGLMVVEDAAQAHGARRHGRPVGSWGLAAGFSFYPGKNLGAYGDGGAVVTDDDEVAIALDALRNHGSRARYEHPTLGFNSRLDTVQAVVLNAKLARLDEWNAARRRAAARYEDLLRGLPGVRLPATQAGNEHVWHLYVVRVPERDRCLAAMSAAGIPAAIHYPTPIHLTGAFAGLGYGPGDFPVAEAAADEILSLPMHPHLTADQQERVAEALAAALA